MVEEYVQLFQPLYPVFNPSCSLALTVVNPAWLSELGKGSLCTYSKPAKNSSGELMVIPRFGPDAWELPAIKADAIR